MQIEILLKANITIELGKIKCLLGLHCLEGYTPVVSLE